MSSIPPVRDRIGIEQDIIDQIKSTEEMEQKIPLIALNYYLQLKKQKDKELELEMEKLASKYNREALKLQQKISDIVEGLAEVQKEELKDIDQYLDENEQGEKQKFNDFIEDTEPIPQYWYKCLQHCPMIKNEIRQQDVNVLNDLIKIEYKPNIDGDRRNFELLFYFKPNDYFLNDVLKKTFTMKDEDEPIKAIANHIEWKEGKDVTKKTSKVIQKTKKSKTKRQITREVDDESFFNFFKSVSLDDEGGIEKMPEEKRGKLEERMNIDYDIARAIIDEVLPYSLEYYLNVRGVDQLDYMNKQDDDDDDNEGGFDKEKQREEKKEDKIQEKPECQQQ